MQEDKKIVVWENAVDSFRIVEGVGLLQEGVTVTRDEVERIVKENNCTLVKLGHVNG